MKISFIIPCYRSEQTIAGVVEELQEALKTFKEYDSEIILVNDASPDNTMNAIIDICNKYDNVTGIELAKNFGQHAAIMAGMNLAEGDMVCCLDDDGQTPANEAYKLVNKIEDGYDAVYARYPKHEKAKWRSAGTEINKRMTESLLGKPKSLEISSFFCVKRFVVDEILKYENSYPYLMGLVLRTTKNICNVDVNHRAREVGQSGYSFKKLVALWINGFTAFSVKPLRFATIGGLCTSIAGFIFTIVTIVRKFVENKAPYGWSSTISILLILGGMILFVLGMIGEYIGRIYISINNSPQYVIRRIVK